MQHQLGVAPSNADLDCEFVITSAAPAPRTRDCARVVHMRARWLTYVCVPPHGEGDRQHVVRPRKSGCYGAVAGMAVVGGCHTTMCVGPAARCMRVVGRFRPMRLRPELPRAGRLQTGRRPGDPEKPQASSPEMTFCRGGVPEAPHTHGGVFLGGPLVGGGPSRCQRISYAPLGRCYPRSRTVQAGDTIVPQQKKKSCTRNLTIIPFWGCQFDWASHYECVHL